MFSPPPTTASARRYTSWLVAGTLALDLVILGMIGVGADQNRRGHEERAATESRNLASLIERDLLSTIRKVDLTLLGVADEAARGAGATPPAEADAAFERFLGRQVTRVPEVRALWTTDAAGQVRQSAVRTRDNGADLADIAPFPDSHSSGDDGLVITSPQKVRPGDAAELVFSRRLTTPAGDFGGIVHAAVRMRPFGESLASIDLGAHGLVMLRDAQLNVLARYPDAGAPGQAPANGFAREMHANVSTQQSSGTFRSDGVDGIRRVVSFRQVGLFPFYAGVGLAGEDYLADWRVERWKALALAVVFLGATSAVAVSMWNAWRRQDRNLQVLRAQERKFRTLVESSPDALVITDAQGRIAIVNRQAEAMFGYTAASLLGQPLALLLPALAGPGRPAPGPGSARVDDLWAVTADARRFPVSISLSPIDTDDGGMTATAIRDVTERRASEERIAFLAHHDALTGLPNRIVMQSRFEQAAAQADRGGSKLALLFLDLDNFKTINDSLGHQVGDALLRAVAARLRETTRDMDTISRQGGDEFLILFAQLPDAETARLMVARLVERFRDPCVVDDRRIATPFSVGIALYPDDGTDFGTLQKHADIAMYQAKAAGRNIHRFFNETMDVEAQERMQLRQDLHQALERDEFVLHYQPQIDLATGRVVGVEALVRWQHPSFGLIGPIRFIPDAETSGQIVSIGDWVLGEACRQARAWADAGVPPMTVAVNMSAVQFARGNVEATVKRAIETSGIDPSLLELELTESILIRDVDSVLATVQSLKRLGVKLSIDDFGTGYSSLSYLTRFAFDKLKIDRSFVAGLTTDPTHAAIVRAIVQMGRGLGVTIIAEGVEDAATCDRLLEFGCDEAQGWLFAAAMPADALAASLSTLEQGASRIASRAALTRVHRTEPLQVA